MYPDPNWLLSTVVQSAAAFVAIVAGFIISRLLALSAERSGLQTRARDINLQLIIKKQSLATLEKRCLEWDAEDFLENPDVLDMIVASKGEISLAEVMSSVTVRNRSKDELHLYWEDAIATTKRAFQLIEKKFYELLNAGNDIDIAIRKLEPNLDSYRWKIYHEVFGYFLNNYEKNRKSFSVMMGSVRLPFVPISDENSGYAQLVREIEAFERDKNALEAQLSDLQIQLKQLGQPKGVTIGVIFLAYFSFTGIIIPVSLLPFPSDQFTSIHKWSIFLLFISGLVFFFVYLVILIRQPSETNDLGNSA